MAKLLDHARDLMRTHHLSIRTEEAYLAWIKQYILFHHKQHPANLGSKDVSSFLSYLAVERHVSASTQRRGEIFSLQWFDVNFEREAIHVRQTKSGKDRLVPMNSIVRAMLESLPKSSS